MLLIKYVHSQHRQINFYKVHHLAQIHLLAGHEIAPNTVANATEIIVLATQIQKNSLGFLYLTLMFFATK